MLVGVVALKHKQKNIYLNTQPYSLFTPQGYLTQFKQKIMREINPLIKKKFATSPKKKILK